MDLSVTETDQHDHVKLWARKFYFFSFIFSLILSKHKNKISTEYINAYYY